jgi:hypothetical protein
MSLHLYDKAMADFNRLFRKQEAENGICSEPGDCFVCDADREPSPVVSIFDEIPMPRDPYGCENPVSGDAE